MLNNFLEAKLIGKTSLLAFVGNLSFYRRIQEVVCIVLYVKEAKQEVVVMCNLQFITHASSFL